MAPVIASNLAFPECPRWHDGFLWFSDMGTGQVIRTDLEGNLETIASVPGVPGGLGWNAEGVLLCVSQKDRAILRLDGGTSIVSDCRSLISAELNDMVVGPPGFTYVSNFGYEAGRDQPRSSFLLRLGSDDVASVQDRVALWRPNGMVLLADRSALIVAETRIGRLSKVCLDVEGNVVRRETFAQVPNGGWPDGICLDATGGVWAADPRAGACFRFDAAGEITQTLPTRLPPFACVLGGDDGRTLFVCMAPFTHPSQSRRQMAGAIEAFRVEVGADGWP